MKPKQENLPTPSKGTPEADLVSLAILDLLDRTVEEVVKDHGENVVKEALERLGRSLNVSKAVRAARPSRSPKDERQVAFEKAASAAWKVMTKEEEFFNMLLKWEHVVNNRRSNDHGRKVPKGTFSAKVAESGGQSVDLVIRFNSRQSSRKKD